MQRHLFTDADNTLWDTNAVFIEVQLGLLRAVENVPWSPSLDKQFGSHIDGIARASGGVDWSFGRKRGIGL